MWCAYCIRLATDPPPAEDLRGPDDRAVRRLVEGPLALWASEGAPPETTLERLRAHDRVVREALRTATPLPVRFGTCFADAERARESLRARREEFLASLGRVRGCVEMSLLVLWDPPSQPDPEAVMEPLPRSGREFLDRRRRRLEREQEPRREAERLLADVEARLAAPDLPTRRQVLPRAEVAGSLAHLVRIEALPGYRERVERLRRDDPDLRLRLTGPWAPYSFVSA